MAKRKSTVEEGAAAGQEGAEGPTAFDCPFCGHTGSVQCSIDLKDMIGEAACAVCKEVYATVANALTEPIDVYFEWIDECEKANEGVDVDDR